MKDRFGKEQYLKQRKMSSRENEYAHIFLYKTKTFHKCVEMAYLLPMLLFACVMIYFPVFRVLMHFKKHLLYC